MKTAIYEIILSTEKLNMEIKKKGFFSLLILLLSVTLGCSDPFTTNHFDDEITPPFGMGSFSVQIDNENVRTILPNVTQSNFMAFSLVFTGTANHTENRTASNFSSPVYLPIGTYNLTVTAYLDAEMNKPVAQGSITDIPIGTGNVSRSIVLTALANTGTGTFSWTIYLPIDVTEAKMKITPIDSVTGTTETNINLLGGSAPNHNESYISLNSGHYKVLFTITMIGNRTLELIEALHIYQNLESNYVRSFDDNTIKVTNTSEWNDALASIRNGGSGTVGNPKTYIINVIGNVAVPGSSSSATSFGTLQHIEVILIGDGTLKLNSQGSILRLGTNQKLVIDSSGLTLEGFDSNNAAVLYVSGADLELKNGRITGNTNFGNFGDSGGVLLYNSNFTMSGGIISDNEVTGIHVSGGGVYAYGTTNFYMSGGVVGNNKATGSIAASGGGVSTSGGTFTMLGSAQIIGNTSSSMGGGVFAQGIFIMEGGIISNNSSRAGGGIVASGIFNMSGGTISNNVCDSSGGGVYVTSDGKFTMTGGIISGNQTTNRYTGLGGGVYIIEDTNGNSGVFTKIGGGTVYGNDAVATLANNASAITVLGNTGHAVYLSSTPARYRDTTLGVDDNISTDITTSPPWNQ